MRWFVILCLVLSADMALAETEMSVNLKPARRQPASVDPARPLKPKNHKLGRGLKADPGRPPMNLRMSPRRTTPILDIDISVKED
ncbi:MAG: hypothetical protein KF767_04930 [Bdellovibrionaceae bacterium]|nr:hypothetical protein [Pseudobdellovibrionaceae bacterium]